MSLCTCGFTNWCTSYGLNPETYPLVNGVIHKQKYVGHMNDCTVTRKRLVLEHTLQSHTQTIKHYVPKSNRVYKPNN